MSLPALYVPVLLEQRGERERERGNVNPLNVRVLLAVPSGILAIICVGRITDKPKKQAMTANTNKTQVAIVTGASSGMGLGITRALLERGYCVVGNSRSISKSKELKASGNLVLVDGDIGKQDTA